MLRLATDRLFPSQTEPGQILNQRGFEFSPATAPVDVLHAEEKTVVGPGCVGRIKGGIGMAQVQQSRGTRGKARDFLIWGGPAGAVMKQ